MMMAVARPLSRSASTRSCAHASSELCDVREYVSQRGAASLRCSLCPSHKNKTVPCRLQGLGALWAAPPSKARPPSTRLVEGQYLRAGLQAEVVQARLAEALLQLCSAQRIRNTLPLWQLP